MGVSIKKSGIAVASGQNILPNLIWNGNAVNGSSKWAGWATATNRSIEYIDGKYWFHHTSDNTGSKYGGWYQDNNTTDQSGSGFKPNTNYTVSAIWFASASANVRFWFHMRSTEGGANISQPATTFTIDTEPKRYYFTFNSGTNASYTINRFNLMMGSLNMTSAVDIYFTDVKMEEGSIMTPYIPNVNDAIYVSGGHAFIENDESLASFGRDYVIGESFHEY